MRHILWCLFLVFWVGPGWGQSVEVRGGEHEGFTRLVLDLPSRMDYTITRRDGGADLRVEGPALNFTTEQVFMRVARTRLTGLAAPAPGVLRLSFGCDCETRSFWHDESYLVVDILDQVAAAEELVVTEVSTTVAPDATPAEGNATPLAAGPESRAGIAPIATAAPEETQTGQWRGGSAAYLVSRALERRGDAVGSDPFPALRLRDDAALLRDSREHLAREFGRAASQGLLSPRTTLPAAAPADTSGALNAPVSQNPALYPAPDPQDRLPRNANMRAQTSVDRDLREAMQAGLAEVQAAQCLDPERTDVTAWGRDLPFHDQVGPLRAALVGEFDEPDPAAVTDLARLYLYFGLGAEARQILLQMDTGAAPDPVLLAMAQILETGSDRAGSILAGQMECSDMTALWSVLSRSELSGNEPLNENAIQRAFAALPRHLRAQLGPGLARRFHEAGLDDDSDRILRTLSRDADARPPAALLLEADVAIRDGETEKAEATLDALVAENAVPSADALLRLIETRVGRGAEISYEQAQLAGAYALEYRGQPMGRDMSMAYLGALAGSGAFEEAFTELGRVLGEDEASLDAMRATLLDILADRAEDDDFLRFALSQGLPHAKRLSPDVADRLASRLVLLGFPTAAEALIAPRIANADDRTRRLLRGRIALAQSKPRQAELELLGLTGEDVSLLRAQARSMAGDHAGAQAMFRSLNRPEAAFQQAWLARDWDRLREADDPIHAQIAELKQAPPTDAVPDPDAVLATNRTMIEESTKTRGLVRALLSAHPVPAE